MKSIVVHNFVLKVTGYHAQFVYLLLLHLSTYSCGTNDRHMCLCFNQNTVDYNTERQETEVFDIKV
jgi:hypothetical protein